jgi:amino acid permease
MAPDDLFSRDEVLGGLPARRAAAMLFLIESRAAHLADRSRRATDFLLSEDADRRRDLVFLEAFSGGREPPVKPTARDLERFAPEWAPLVPPNPPMRAAIAHMLGRKYTFTRAAVPRLRTALGLDDDAVERAYRRQYREDLAAIYAVRIRTAERLRVGWSALSARLDSLPPFWLTFFLTIAFSFSQAFLALPTGVAGMGAMRGVVLVVAIGLVNVLTMACMAEACARSGDFRYGKAFLGRLVTGYLGGEASLVFSVITALRTFLVMLAGSIGIALTLASSTGIRAEVWIAGVAAAELYYLSRKSQTLTITTMLTLVGVNLLLFLLIMGFALGRVEPANLLRASALLREGTPFDPTVLKLVFGVIVMLYIGHVYVVQCAKIVLPRDPGGRSLIQGSVAGTVVLIAIFTGWILAVNGVVPAARLAREAGTALPSLAERIGPAVHVLGALLVILLLGMSCLRTSTVMFNLVQERLPTRLRATVTLARRKGDLLFEPRRASANGLRLGVRYLGLTEGRARLRIDAQRDGDIERTEVVVAHTWDAADVFRHLTADRMRAGSLMLEVLEAQPEALRVRVTTTMSLSAAGDFTGAERHLGDATELPDPLRGLAIWLTRRGEATLSEVVQDRGGEPHGVRVALDELVAQGFVERVDRTAAAEPRYRARLAARQGRQVPSDVWAALGQPTAEAAGAPVGRRGPRRMRLFAWDLILGERGQFVVSTSPILLVFLISEALLFTGTASFAGVLGFGGVIANSMTAGIFPVLLLLASRRKGDCVPGAVYRLLGHPAFTASVYALSVVNLFVHGLVIYRDPWTRACALIFGVVVLGVTARMIRAGAFTRRSVIELREDMREGGLGVLTIMSGGRPLPVEITLGHPEGEETSRGTMATVPALSKLRYATVQLPAGSARELKVWGHRVTLAGTSDGLPALVDVHCGGETRRFDLKLSSGQAIVRTGGAGCRVRITLAVDAEG